MTIRFILASGSPRRRELLTALGIAFTVVKSDIDETQRPGEDPVAYACRLSVEKAAAVHAQIAPSVDPLVVIAADTVVIDDAVINEGVMVLGKPADPDEARQMLVRLRGRAHTVCTALTVLKQIEGRVETETRETRTQVWMRAYSDAEIAAYIATGDPFDKAGGYAIQHPEFRPAERIEGSHTNVVGLPVETLTAMLGDLAIPLANLSEDRASGLE